MLTSFPTHAATVIAKFKALADPFRFEVVELLQQQEMCVCDLCDRMGIAQSKLSFHLKTLRAAGLITARQEGRWVYYSLNPAAFTELEDYLVALRQQGPGRSARVCSPTGD
ncbi:MAG TPA: winged helix-turn-helix transcriptional regulator [Leptolyngbyaceae cyanobacterium M65_K2018_010]|nr:winged helix-turn-helix transcriptional regulator [Leptolyngbyaceae cyanobacterium M65_K2018_010]